MATSERPLITGRDIPSTDERSRDTDGRRTEYYLRRALTMKTSLAKNIHKCNPQTDSPLWKLPQEIRDMIWQLVTVQYEDLSEAYQEHKDWYRPDHRGPLRSSTGVLRTCRRAWLEANALPMQSAVHLFWHDTKIHDAKHDRLPGRWWQEFGSRLTYLNVQNLRSIHLMFQIYNLPRIMNKENSVEHMVRYLKPKIFKVTNRCYDWPSSDWRDLGLRTRGFEKQTRHGVANMLEACTGHVERFQLALEVPSRRWDEYGAFFETIRHQKASKNLGMTRVSYNAVPVGSHLSVVGEPSSWQWRRPDYYVSDDNSNAKYLELRVLELEWMHVCDPAESPVDGKAELSTSPGRDQPSIHSREGDHSLDAFLWQYHRIQQHSQDLSEVFGGQCRKRFAKQLVEMETGVPFSRYAPEGSLLCIVEY